jgi:hypothetical protein
MLSVYNIVADDPNDGSITLLLDGRFGEDALPDLDASIARARRGHDKVYIDLSEVTLVDRKAVQYLSDQAGGNVELVNCPAHLACWIQETQ